MKAGLIDDEKKGGTVALLILTVLKGPDKGRRFELPDDEPQLLGRSSEALPLSDRTISRRHAELTPDDGEWYITDLKSANGTWVNGLRLTERRLLKLGDQIHAGNTLLVFGRRPSRGKTVRDAKEGELESHVEATTSSDESLVLAVQDPTEEASLQLKMIYELTQFLGTIADRKQLLERVMDLIFDHFKADRGFILLQDEDDERPEPAVVRHRVPPKEKSDVPITVSRTIVQHVIKKSQGVLSHNAMTDKRFETGDSVQKYHIRSAMCVPIKFKSSVFGVIYLDSQIANYTYTEDQLRLLTAIGFHTGMAVANEKLHAQRLSRERLAAMGQAVASLAHSIKNMVQGLRGGAEVVELGMRKENMTLVKNGWEIVARNLERVSSLAMNMLVFSKPRTPELTMTSLGGLLDEIVLLVRPQFEHKKVELTVAVDQNMPPIPIDPTGIHQAVLNLLDNAMDAVEAGEGKVNLRCGYDERHHTVRIVVSDNGRGIGSESRKQLFEPFHSTKGLRGTGLGLAVTKKIVEEHGGKIGVASVPRKGAAFTLTLPTQQGAAPASTETMGSSISQGRVDPDFSV